MKKSVSILLIVAWVAPLLAVDGKKAAYIGGTATVFTGAKDPLEGTLNTTDPETLILTVEDKPFKGAVLKIPYAKFVDIEYGQKAGRRVGTAVATTVLLGPIGLVSLFSKKRKHYVTIGFKGEDEKDQVAVLELGKDIVRTTLPILEKRSGKSITYQDEEAKKASRGRN